MQEIIKLTNENFQIIDQDIDYDGSFSCKGYYNKQIIYVKTTGDLEGYSNIRRCNNFILYIMANIFELNAVQYFKCDLSKYEKINKLFEIYYEYMNVSLLEKSFIFSKQFYNTQEQFISGDQIIQLQNRKR